MAGMVDDVMATPEPPTPTVPSLTPAPALPVRQALYGPWRALFAAVFAGLVMLLAFPPYGVWFLAPVGVALLGLATFRRGFWASAGLGALTGLALLIPLLSWAGGYVGAVWLFLPVGESFYFALLGGLSALVSPVLIRWRWTWPLATGSLWVLQEALRDRTPFGGFPWGRLAFSQDDSPLLRLAALGGAPLVTFAVGALGGLLALAGLALRDITLARANAAMGTSAARAAAKAAPVRAGRDGQPARSPVRLAALALALAVAFTAVPLVIPTGSGSPATAADQLRVAIVQGNVPRLGLEFNAQRRAVLDNHVNATLALAANVAAGRTPQPDVVVWPENSSDIDPLRNADARARIDQAATAIHAPILVGAVLDGTELENAALVWEPGIGPTGKYVKQHPVPFAEYIPIRPFVRLITDKVDLVQTNFAAGHSPGVLRLGPATIGDVICFEVAYDNIVRDTVTGGAQLIVVQTNNATFNESEARQQLAMVRLRAVEHGRPALMASTVGVSAFVDPDGTVHDATQFNAAAVIEHNVTLRSTRTVATALGEAPEIALMFLAVGIVLAGAASGRTRRKAGR
jgi:apolipoprotein N-acyltransferase